MRILVTGACGQLGNDIIDELIHRGHIVFGTDIHQDFDKKCPYKKCDITLYDDVEILFNFFKPNIVIHCAAWTNVDAAESPENYKNVYNINVIGTENIAKCCKTFDCKMVYFSTDYVFDGSGSNFWEPDDECHPLSFYGKTKLQGEEMVEKHLQSYFILRISWVFGKNGKNFVNSMINLANKGFRSIKVVNDQIGNPTYTKHLSILVAEIINTRKYGLYHVTNDGDPISWYDFAKKIFDLLNMKIEIIPVSTKDYGQNVAVRPLNSRLSKRKLAENNIDLLPSWETALKEYLMEIGQYEIL